MGDSDDRVRARSTVWSLRVLVAALLGLVVYGLIAVPAGRYIQQRSDVADRQVQLRDMKERNSALKDKIRRLDDPDEIMRIARRDYGLVTEGEESYTILPPATAGLNLPASWPFDLLSEPVRRVSSGRG
ncbi:MAG: septum formation initiator family protein [Microthrixaceae bacterium]